MRRHAQKWFLSKAIAIATGRRSRSRHEVKQVYIRLCFRETATADAFRNRFGGESLTHTSAKPKARTSAMSSDAPAVTRDAEEEWGR